MRGGVGNRANSGFDEGFSDGDGLALQQGGVAGQRDEGLYKV